MIDLWGPDPKPVLQVMEKLGEYAAKQGLTEEKLGDLLKDDMYRALALSSESYCIVSGDNDLLILDPFHNIRIITPKEFIDQY